MVLAMKPMFYRDALSALEAEASAVDPLDVNGGGRLWISIMAGVTVADLREAISPVDPHCRVVRTIPNTPMKASEQYCSREISVLVQ